MTDAGRGISDEGGVSGSTFYGPTAFQVGDHNVLHAHFHTPAIAPLDAAARDLRRMVAAQWNDEAATQGLFAPDPLEVLWAPAQGALADDVKSVGGSLHLRSDQPAALAEAFRGLPRRRLVVLGSAGAGKTTLAILLVLALLRNSSLQEPVPVMLSLREWDPEHEHVRAWLARRMEEDYPALRAHRVYGNDAIGRLISARRVLPVLDGLDELPRAHRALALREMNRALSADDQLLVTCRTEEYVAAARAGGVTAAAVVEAEPIRPCAAARYLHAAVQPYHMSRWDRLLRELKACQDVSRPTPLAEAMTSALTVWLVRTVYADPTRDSAELLDTRRFPDSAAIEEHLAEALIPALYAPRPTPPAVDGEGPRLPPSRYPPEQARCWLAFLAGHMPSGPGGSGDLVWWRVVDMLPQRARRLAFSLYGLLCAAVLGTFTTFEFDVGGGVVVGLIAGSFGMMFGMDSHRFSTMVPSRLETPLRAWLAGIREMRLKWLILGLASALTVFALLSYVLGPGHGTPLKPDSGWATQVAIARAVLALALLFVLLFSLAGIEPVDVTARAPSPTALLRTDRSNSLLKAIFSLGICEVAMAIIGGLVIMRPGSLLPAARGGFEIGFVAASATIVFFTAWGRWLLARVVLATSRRLPWRLVRFLEDARQRGMLRQMGGVYQFRHAELRQFLSRANSESSNPMGLEN